MITEIKFNKPEPKKSRVLQMFLILCFILFFIMIFSSDDSNNGEIKTSPQSNQQQAPQNQLKEIGSSPQLIGKWFESTNVYLGKNERTGVYGAIFEPAFSGENMSTVYRFILNLIDHVWGRNQLIEGVAGLTPHFEEREGATLIFYEGKNNSRFYALVVKEEGTKNVVAISFWKEP